jgi:hypothetical protein
MTTAPSKDLRDGGHTAYQGGHGIVLLGVRRGKLFACYDAVTALTGRFCQDPLSDEPRLCYSARPTRTDVSTSTIDRVERTDAPT